MTGGPGRIAALDILRGVAIFGTLGTNIWIFTDPAGPVGVLSAVPGAVETFLRFLANGKFLGLLTLLFGVGLELQYRSARRRGTPWPGWYLWRAALLLVEGLLHYVLVFEFDVLMSYAVTSMVVAYLVGRSDRAVRGWMIGAGTVHVAMVALLTWAMVAAPPAAAPQRLASGRADLFTRGSWAEQVADRIALAPVYRIEALVILPMGIVLFLAGSRLLRAGAFADSPAGRCLRTRLVLCGLGIAAPLNLLTAFSGPEWFLVDRYLLPPLVALGLLGLITSAVHRLRPAAGLVSSGLAAVGRTALSCYVVQNVVAGVLCYGWGLGLAARLAGARPWWVLGAWAGICVLCMLLAQLWLRRFDRGPLELLWHRAYPAPQRSGPEATPAAVSSTRGRGAPCPR